MPKSKPEQLPEEAKEYFLLYGLAISCWANLEHVLGFWFAYLSGMDSRVAAEIFHFARSFNGASDMLWAAYEANDHRPELTTFFEAGMKKVRSYYGFRNFLAHHQTFYNAARAEMFLAKTTDWMMEKKVITSPQMRNAVENFENLKTIFLDALPSMLPKPSITLAKGLQLIEKLPAEADSMEAPRSSPRKKRQHPKRAAAKAT